MTVRIKTFLNRSLLIFNFLILAAYLLACLVPFLSAGKFWFISLLGLGFPFLLILVITGLIVFIIKRSKWAFLQIGVLLLGLQQIIAMFSFHFGSEFRPEKKDDTIRVLSWNVSRWDERNRAKREVPYRELMMDLIKVQDADVLCLQEFFDCTDSTVLQANLPEIPKMGFPYHYFFESVRLFEGRFHYGLLIASKYPIIDSGKSINNAQAHSEGIAYADIKVKDKVFRIINSHLESVGFNKEDYQELGSIQTSRGILGKLKRSYYLRSEQAEGVKKYVRESPYPVIHCSDLDDVPNSYAYFTVKGNTQDAFLKKGSGLGRTFRYISPTLRIDYIFADRKLKVDQYTRLINPYSDHYCVIADIGY